MKKKKIPGPNIGAVAYTVGFPLGQTHLKITKGIISGQQCGLFQTDAPINGGNSGGPLVWDNKIIGINSSGYFFSQNVAYAIPITRLLRLIDYHEEHPECSSIRFPRNWGASFAPPSALISSATHDDSKDSGLEVRGVFPHQLLHGTSIRKGDVILRVNGIPVSSLGEMPVQWMSQNMNLYNFFFHLYLGQVVKIEYLSGKKKMTDKILVRPESDKIYYRQWNPEHEKIPHIYFCGMIIVPFCPNIMSKRFKFLKTWDPMDENPVLMETKDADDPDLLRFMRPKEWGTGRLFVSNIVKGSIVEKRHLIKIGDIIETINKKHVSTIDEARRILLRAVEGGKDEIQIGMCSGSIFRITPKMVREEEERLVKIYTYTSEFITPPESDKSIKISSQIQRVSKK
jgi:S1-C subfamily serine protease